ncbi:titin [Chlorella sorokiniana]|uniref:Titin n=1 Tax=Chlorella sorokiniana TaxID=3076 RepID=A0A2P6TIS3_CHLSO|nr:titin [Chlorella sorokiniana]|eukprot:PRW39148.1 titin [Chlorella sorokiniana]
MVQLHGALPAAAVVAAVFAVLACCHGVHAQVVAATFQSGQVVLPPGIYTISLESGRELCPEGPYLSVRGCGEPDALYGSSGDDCSLRQRWRLGEPTGKTVSTMCYRPPNSLQVNIQSVVRAPSGSPLCESYAATIAASCLSTSGYIVNSATAPAANRPGCPVIVGVSGVALAPIDVVLTAPVNNGGSPIVSYRVDGVPATAGRANITVTGLGKALSLTQVLFQFAVGSHAFGEQYTFWAYAINGVGMGPACAPYRYRAPPGCPGSPGIFSIVQVASGAVEVVLTPPASDSGSPITSYAIVATPAAGGSVGVGGTLGQPVSGTNRRLFTFPAGQLKPSTCYGFTASSTNAICTGGNSARYEFCTFAPPALPPPAGKSPPPPPPPPPPLAKPPPVTPSPSPPPPSITPTRPGCTVIIGVTGISNGRVSLLVATPLNSGGTPVLSYRIDGVPATAGRLNITANGLGQALSPNQLLFQFGSGGYAPGEQYTFWASAINGVGQGPACVAYVYRAPPSCPGSPRISTVRMGAAGGVEVLVVPPAVDNGSPVTSYSIVAMPLCGGFNVSVGGTMGAIVPGSNQRLFVFSAGHCKPAACFAFVASASNAVCQGPDSPPSPTFCVPGSPPPPLGPQPSLPPPSGPTPSPTAPPGSLPGAPTIFFVTMSGTNLQIFLSPPAATNGAVIVEYQVVGVPQVGGRVISVRGPGQWLFTDKRLFVFLSGDYEAGQAYYFSAWAITSLGLKGPESQPPYSFNTPASPSPPPPPLQPPPPPAGPGSPDITSVVGTSGGSINVTVVPPLVRSGTVTAYAVVGVPANGGNNITLTGLGTSLGGSRSMFSFPPGTYRYGVPLTFYATAIVAGEEGPPSGPAYYSTPPSRPGAPFIESIKALPTGDLELVVIAPDDGGLPIYTYNVLGVNTQGGPNATFSQLGVLLTGGRVRLVFPAYRCLSETSYTFVVAAANGVGEGPWSPPYQFITPPRPGPPPPFIAFMPPPPPSFYLQPDPPTILGVSAVPAATGTDALAVSLMPPTNTGGRAITGYRLMAVSSAGTVMTEGSGTPLGNGQIAMAFAPGAIKPAAVYTLYGFASNSVAPSGGFDAAGSSPASLPYFLPRPPEPPTITSVQQLPANPSVVVIKLERPLINGGRDITGYRITARSAGLANVVVEGMGTPTSDGQLAFSFPPGSILVGVAWEIVAQASNGVSGAPFDISGASDFSSPPYKVSFSRAADAPPPPVPVPSPSPPPPALCAPGAPTILFASASPGGPLLVTLAPPATAGGCSITSYGIFGVPVLVRAGVISTSGMGSLNADGATRTFRFEAGTYSYGTSYTLQAFASNACCGKGPDSAPYLFEAPPLLPRTIRASGCPPT